MPQSLNKKMFHYQVMIGGSLPKLKEMNVGTFDDVIGYMKNIEFLSANENSYTERYDSFNNTEVGIKDFIDRENVVRLIIITALIL